MSVLTARLIGEQSSRTHSWCRMLP
jgi:hypothetical protein